MPLSEEDRESLVAYLDGELDDRAAQSLEARLNTEPALRAEAEALKQTWDLLDYLPRPQPSGSFTHRTLERLNVHRPPATMIMLPRRSWTVWLGRALFVAFLLLTGGVSFAVSRQLWTRPVPVVTPPDPAVKPAALTTEEKWLQSLPRAYRQQLASLKGEVRRQEIARLRLEETRWNVKWQLASKHWQDLLREKRLPARRRDLPAEVKTFVREYLSPMLSDAEKKRLEKAEGHWPLFPCTLVDLADQHPVALPCPRGPWSLAQLPTDVQERLRRDNLPLATLRAVEGKPEFAVAVTQLAAKLKISLPNELWPSQPKDLSRPVQDFIADKLRPVLSDAEKIQLKEAEGSWPRYPETIRKLAGQHNLQVPWQSLPPPRNQSWSWDSYRVPHYELVGDW
jgi:hypothetical protein